MAIIAAAARPVGSPSSFDRTLLRMSSLLSLIAARRMQRRAGGAARRAVCARVIDEQRDVAAIVRAALLPR